MWQIHISSYIIVGMARVLTKSTTHQFLPNQSLTCFVMQIGEEKKLATTQTGNHFHWWIWHWLLLTCSLQSHSINGFCSFFSGRASTVDMESKQIALGIKTNWLNNKASACFDMIFLLSTVEACKLSSYLWCCDLTRLLRQPKKNHIFFTHWVQVGKFFCDPMKC